MWIMPMIYVSLSYSVWSVLCSWHMVLIHHWRIRKDRHLLIWPWSVIKYKFFELVTGCLTVVYLVFTKLFMDSLTVTFDVCSCAKADDVQSLLQAAMPATQLLPVATKSALLMSPMLPVSPQSSASSPTYVVLCRACCDTFESTWRCCVVLCILLTEKRWYSFTFAYYKP